MNGEYPIIIDGQSVGKLEVWKDGLMTVFEARCPDVERLVRLYVFGPDGQQGSLGVMIPDEDGLHIRKCFSRSALESMPSEISYASETQIAQCESQDTEAAAEPEPEAAEEPECEMTDTIWFPVPEGTLISLAQPSLLAMPWREGTSRGETRWIEGRRYAVISPEEIEIPGQ